jgi:glycine cleavage system H protein
MVTHDSAGPTNDELPCIWVLSGVLNYRICDRQYDCEHCDLFRALSGGVHPDEPTTWFDEQVSGHLCHLLSGCRLYLDRPYVPPSLWLLPDEDGAIRVGLDCHLVRILAPIRDVVTPGVGVWLDRGQPCGWIARDRSAVNLHMPVAGRILSVNHDFAPSEPTAPSEPSAPASKACEWILRVMPDRPLDETEGLIQGERVLMWYLQRIRILKRYLGAAVMPDPTAALGPVMADGGVWRACLEDVVGREAFERLVEDVTAVSC